MQRRSAPPADITRHRPLRGTSRRAEARTPTRGLVGVPASAGIWEPPEGPVYWLRRSRFGVRSPRGDVPAGAGTYNRAAFVASAPSWCSSFSSSGVRQSARRQGFDHRGGHALRQAQGLRQGRPPAAGAVTGPAGTNPGSIPPGATGDGRLEGAVAPAPARAVWSSGGRGSPRAAYCRRRHGHGSTESRPPTRSAHTARDALALQRPSHGEARWCARFSAGLGPAGSRNGHPPGSQPARAGPTADIAARTPPAETR